MDTGQIIVEIVFLTLAIGIFVISYLQFGAREIPFQQRLFLGLARGTQTSE